MITPRYHSRTGFIILDGDYISMNLARGIQQRHSEDLVTANKLGKTRPEDLDPVKEWNRVKLAWNGDAEAWQRYSGFKLPEEEAA